MDILFSILSLTFSSPNTCVIWYKSGVRSFFVTAILIIIAISPTFPLYLSGLFLKSFLSVAYSNSSATCLIFSNHSWEISLISKTSKYLFNISFESVFNSFDNRDDKFHLYIFIYEYQEEPYILLIRRSQDTHEDIFEKIMEKIKEIILRKINIEK